MALTGNKIFNTVKQFTDGVLTSTQVIDETVLENTYNGNLELYLQNLFPGITSLQTTTLDSTRIVLDETACSSCEITVSGLDSSTDYSALVVGNGLTGGTIWRSLDQGLTWTKQFIDTNIGFYWDVAFPSHNIAYVCSDVGNILKSTDGGANWSVITTALTSNIKSICFINDLTGYAIGESRIFKTTDGAVTWVEQINPDPSLSLHRIVFPVNDIIGFIAAANGKILKTDNAGSTWTIKIVSGYSGSVYDIHFPNKQITIGYAGGVEYIIKTLDGGNSWSATALDPALNALYSQSIYFLNESTGVAGAIADKIIKTTNGGASWFITPGTINFFSAEGMDFFDDGTDNLTIGLATGETVVRKDYIFRTTNQFDSKAVVASSVTDGAEGPVKVKFAKYSISTLRFIVSGARTTIKAELKSGTTVVATLTNLQNGMNEFTNVTDGTYTIVVTDEVDLTCTHQSTPIVYAQSQVNIIVGSTSQVSGTTTVDVTWKVIVDSASTVGTLTEIINVNVETNRLTTGAIGTDSFIIEMIADLEVGTLKKTYTKLTSAYDVTMTIKPGVGYTVGILNTISVTIDNDSTSSAFGRCYAEKHTAGSNLKILGGGKSAIVYASDVTESLKFTAINDDITQLTFDDRLIETPDNITVDILRRSKNSTGAFGGYIGGFFERYSSITLLDLAWSVYDYNIKFSDALTPS